MWRNSIAILLVCSSLSGFGFAPEDPLSDPGLSFSVHTAFQDPSENSDRLLLASLKAFHQQKESGDPERRMDALRQIAFIFQNTYCRNFAPKYCLTVILTLFGRLRLSSEL